MSDFQKIINDPVHGFITIPNRTLYNIIEHRFFQRLSRIRQLGLTYMVYPGAQHTRFQHSLGAMHLMHEAISTLRVKGVEITDSEETAAMAAILLHDVGHAPFSHVLERTFVRGITHEEISELMMREMSREMLGGLDMAVSIFRGEYPKRFLHQLVSGQLDADRLDYLVRDSYFTGVVEGMIGAERLLKMVAVSDAGNLCVEAKGIYSIEKFLIARRMMYWQVYYHKASIAAEQVLISLLRRAKCLAQRGVELFAPPSLRYFLYNDVTAEDFYSSRDGATALQSFSRFDDSDIYSAIKVWQCHTDSVLSLLSEALVDRKLFKVSIRKEKPTEEETSDAKKRIRERTRLSEEEVDYLYSVVGVSGSAYSANNGTLEVIYSDGRTSDITEASDIFDVTTLSHKEMKYYICAIDLEGWMV